MQLSIIERVGALLDNSDDGELQGLESLLQQLQVTAGRAPTEEARSIPTGVPLSPDSSSGEVIDSYVPMHTVDELGRDEVELFMKTDDLEELFEIDGSHGAEADAPPAAAAAAAATASSADVAAVVAALGQVAQSRNTLKGSEGSGESVA